LAENGRKNIVEPRYGILGGWSANRKLSGFDDRLEVSSRSFNALIENAKEVLSHYVNRRGDNVPSQLKSRGQLALWLMEKDDGTMMGLKRQSLWQKIRNQFVR